MATQIQLGLLYSMTYTLKFESEGKLRTKGYDKTDYFYIPIETQIFRKTNFNLTLVQWLPCYNKAILYHGNSDRNHNLKFESEGKLRTKGYDKTDYFYIPIMYFPLIYEATSNQQLHMKYTSLSSCDQS
jgi:hypothetical protein